MYTNNNRNKKEVVPLLKHQQYQNFPLKNQRETHTPTLKTKRESNKNRTKKEEYHYKSTNSISIVFPSTNRSFLHHDCEIKIREIISSHIVL